MLQKILKHTHRLTPPLCSFLNTSSSLSHEIITAKISPSSPPPASYQSSIVFLHGILGSGQNLRSFARKVANAYPGTKCVLVDLRGHGDSPSIVGPSNTNNTVDACADDVSALMTNLSIKPKESILWGHSFGGKVVLSLLSNQVNHMPCKAAWIIDSQPGLVPLKGFHNNQNPQSVEGIIGALSTLKPPFESKEMLMQQIGAHGIDRAIQTWMTTNVERDENAQFQWKFNLDVVKELFVDYCQKDMWATLSNNNGSSDAAALDPNVKLHLVRGMKNPFWERSTTQELLESALKSNSNLYCHDVDAGHWLHAEKPKELFDVMVGAGLEEDLL